MAERIAQAVNAVPRAVCGFHAWDLSLQMKRKLKANTYRIVTDAVSRGIQPGIGRYYKYRPYEPELTDRDELALEVLSAIMLEICEVINFEEDS